MLRAITAVLVLASTAAPFSPPHSKPASPKRGHSALKMLPAPQARAMRGHYPSRLHVRVHWYPQSRYEVLVEHKLRGMTLKGARQYYQAEDVLPGCFFGEAWADRKRCYYSLDWAVVRGAQKRPRHTRWSWPAYTEDWAGRVRIDQYPNTQKSYKFAMAGRFYPPFPNDIKARRMIGFVDDQWVVVKYKGTYAAGLSILSRERIPKRQIMHTDGGHATLEATRLAAVYVIRKRVLLAKR